MFYLLGVLLLSCFIWMSQGIDILYTCTALRHIPAFIARFSKSPWQMAPSKGEYLSRTLKNSQLPRTRIEHWTLHLMANIVPRRYKPTAPTASTVGSCPTIIQTTRTTRHWKLPSTFAWPWPSNPLLCVLIESAFPFHYNEWSFIRLNLILYR